MEVMHLSITPPTTPTPYYTGGIDKSLLTRVDEIDMGY